MIPPIRDLLPLSRKLRPPTSALLTPTHPSDLSPVLASSGQLSLASLTRSDLPAVCSQGTRSLYSSYTVTIFNWRDLETARLSHENVSSVEVQEALHYPTPRTMLGTWQVFVG